MIPISEGLQQFQDGLANEPGLLVRHLGQKGQPGFPQNQRNQYTRVILSNDRVQLPVPDAAAAFDDGRILPNRLPIRDLALTVIRGISLPTRLLVAQMRVQVATVTLVLKNILVIRG